MGTVYVFFADGFEEMEAFATVDILRRAGVKVQMVTVTEDEIVKGAHGVPVLCDMNIVNCDFFDAAMLVLPGGLPLGGLGLLKGKKATCYPGFDKYLEGAEYTGAMVEKDGNIITGKGPGACMKFALALVEHLCGKEKVKELEEAMCLR